MSCENFLCAVTDMEVLSDILTGRSDLVLPVVGQGHDA